MTLTHVPGVSTTADALSAMLFHLSQPVNFPRQERLRTELKEHGISNGSSFTLEQVKKVGFLECIIKETLRTNPPMPVSLERTVPPDCMIKIHGKSVSSGVSLPFPLSLPFGGLLTSYRCNSVLKLTPCIATRPPSPIQKSGSLKDGKFRTGQRLIL